MKQLIISGKELRMGMASKVPIRKGMYRLWLKLSEFKRLFGEDAAWLVKHFNQGEGLLENHFCIFYHTFYCDLQEHLERILTQEHDLRSIEKEGLGLLRTHLSSLLSGDQSDKDITNEFIDLSIFEIITYKNHEIRDDLLDKKTQGEKKKHFLPFQTLENITHPQLSSFSIKLKEMLNEAKELGELQILCALPHRPSSHHYWNHEYEYWARPSSINAFRFKGVDDSDFD